MRKLIWTAAVIVGLTVFLPHLASAAPAAHPGTASALKAVQEVLDTPENKLDLARAKLLFDKVVDPSIDVERTLREIDRMTATVKTLTGPNATTMQKLAAVRRFIYMDGDWSGHRPFAYDLTDPFGKKIKNKLLTTYLATRRGNCVSMPVLYLILGDRLGLKLTLSTAPLHIFVKFTDDKGKTFNLETTSGALPARDAWYRENYAMTDDAVRNGVYLKTLSRSESLAVMAGIVLEHLAATKRYADAIGMANLIMKHYPNDIGAILTRGSAFGALIQTEFQSRYPTPRDIPIESRATYMRYIAENQRAFERAEALGWRETDGEKPRAAPSRN